MNFQEAAKKLNELAGGEYTSMTYEVTQKAGGVIDVKCRVYMHGYDFYSAQTWEIALGMLDDKLNPIEIMVEDIESIPVVSVDIDS